MNRFEKSAQSWQEIVDLIQETPLGMKTLGQFLPLIQSGKVQVRTYPSDLRAELEAAKMPGDPLGAAFATDGDQGQIFYDGQGEFGIQVPFVFHEMIHSLDPSLWQAAGKKLTKKDRKELVFLSEHRAHTAQHEFQTSLKKLYPELEAFHKSRYSHLVFLNRALSPQEILNLYIKSVK